MSEFDDIILDQVILYEYQNEDKILFVSSTYFSISNTFSGFRVWTYFMYSELLLSNMENLTVYEVDISPLEKHDAFLKINKKFDSYNMSYNVLFLLIT